MKNATRISALILFLFTLNLILGCASVSWLDNGEKYLCPKCRKKVASELAPCIRCGKNVTPYNYCYECAKELNCCQLCGEKRK